MIFFDIDGTLLDYDYAEREGILDFFRSTPNLDTYTEKQSIEIWKQLSHDYFEKYLANELSFEEQKRLRMIELFKRVETKLTNKEADEKFKSYLSFYKKCWKPYSDVKEVLGKLIKLGYSLGVISNGDYDQQVDKLQCMGIEGYFECIVTSSKVGVAKPNQAIFVDACRQTSTPMENCFYVGDKLEADALGSRMAGMRGIWLNRKDEQYQGDITVIKSLHELLTVIT